MALQKQNLNIPFAQGIDTKTDPNQIPIGKFQSLKNAAFSKGKRLQKRNGYQFLPSLVDSSNKSLTTYKDNLIALGNNLNELSLSASQWFNKGVINSVELSVNPVVRNTSSQQTVDISATSDGLSCVTWKDLDGNNYYRIIDTNSGNVLVASGTLEAGAVFARVNLLGSNFIVSYLVSITGTVHLRYITIPAVSPTAPSSPHDISTLVSSISAPYDAVSINGNLYFAWNSSGGNIRLAFIDTSLTLHVVIALPAQQASLISMTTDSIGVVIWLSFISNTGTLKCAAFSALLTPILPVTTITTGLTSTALTSAAYNGTLTMYYQNTNTYSYSSVRSDFVSHVTCTQTGTVGSPSVLLRSVGIASKAFIYNTNPYLLVTYSGSFQPTYFLIDASGNVVSKLAYGNGGGYAINQILSNAVLYNNTVQIGSLFKDLVIPVNKSQGVTTTGGFYGQTGINISSFTFAVTPQSLEIADLLIINGGIVRMYDGIKPVELGFNLWPEDLGYTTMTTTGSMTSQLYNYQAVYEWTDSQGNIHRSAPSVPLVVDLTGAGTSTNKVTINVPTLRITYKTGINSVRIVIYRWSLAQQNFYQVTSITAPVANSTTTDSVQFVDTQADSAIIGNPLIYTTGGIIENIAPPPANSMSLYRSRLFLIDAEDTNLVWFSKQVIENTTVEMSDLFTKFLSPNVSASGNTGPTQTLYAMDDKLIASKAESFFYMTGNGPDNNGAQDDFSDFIFITSTVGTDNEFSLAFIPNGIVFKSDKGIWLLGRDLSTQYIGAPVENFNGSEVLSALTIPGTNQVRFTLDNGSTLMYDYYFDQWGEFVNIPALFSVIFQGLHTFINSFGQILQETPNMYLDGSSPVLMSFTTGWLNLAGVQGFQRAYYFYLLGEYLTPHKLQLQIAYDYDQSNTQQSLISPDNFSPVLGTDSILGGSSPLGGPSPVEQWQVFLIQQKCQAFQITLSEMYDPQFNIAYGNGLYKAGAGLYLSGINLVVGQKGGSPKLIPERSVG